MRRVTSITFNVIVFIISTFVLLSVAADSAGDKDPKSNVMVAKHMQKSHAPSSWGGASLGESQNEGVDTAADYASYKPSPALAKPPPKLIPTC